MLKDTSVGLKAGAVAGLPLSFCLISLTVPNLFSIVAPMAPPGTIRTIALDSFAEAAVLVSYFMGAYL